MCVCVCVCVCHDRFSDIGQNNQSKLYNLLFENVLVKIGRPALRLFSLEAAGPRRCSPYTDNSKVRLAFFLFRTLRERRGRSCSSYLSCERYRYTVSLSTTESFRSRNSSESFPLYSSRRAGRGDYLRDLSAKNGSRRAPSNGSRSFCLLAWPADPLLPGLFAL